jgi:DNA-binding LytR/AlgR family response regulator
MNINCLIIDDGPYAADLLEIYIQKSTNWAIVAKCYDAVSALMIIKTNPPDLVFLGINTPALNGLEFAELLPRGVKIVFITAYSEHAAESYNYQTIDYLLKPLTLKRFMVTVQKVEYNFNRSPDVIPSKISADNKHFYIKSGKTLHKIILEQILYFEGQKEYVNLVTVDGHLLIYRRLKDIEKQFSPPFIRVHNSYIINLNYLKKVSDNQVYLGSTQIPISDKFKESFMNAIGHQII